MAATAADAHPYPIYNARYRAIFPILDVTSGAPLTAAGSPDSEASQDGGAFADVTNEATEIGSTGHYTLDLIATEMDTVCTTVQVKAAAPARTTTLDLRPRRLP